MTPAVYRWLGPWRRWNDGPTAGRWALWRRDYVAADGCPHYALGPWALA